MIRQPSVSLTLSDSFRERIGLSQLIGNSEVFVNEVRKIPTIAKCNANVLISGETGTGKELFARAVHYLSPRAHAPFVAVNCGGTPIELLENELFGHERGAFTGADRSERGLVQEADGGTLFLDEIDCLPLPGQVKLLRFLQDKEFRPLGSKKTHRVNARVVSATNSLLDATVRSGALDLAEVDAALARELAHRGAGIGERERSLVDRSRRAGAWRFPCRFTCRNRFPYRTTQSLPITRSVSNRKTSSSSARFGFL